MSYIIIGLSALFFLGHILNWLFTKTKIPDLLILVIIGYIGSSVLGWVEPAHLGKVGDTLSTVALIVILYECGIHLSLKDLASSSLPALGLSVIGFSLIVLVGAVLAYFVAGQPLAISVLFGLAIGSTSSAVVIPIVKNLNIAQNTKTILSLESAFTDVLTIVTFLVILDSFISGRFSMKELLFGIGPKTLISAGIGMGLAIIWSYLKASLPSQSLKRPFANEAWALFSYGIMELNSYNGAIGVLALGFMLANMQLIPSFLRPKEPSITPQDVSLLNEISFLLKTFFFIYLGILIKFKGLSIIIFASVITALIFVTRYISIKLMLSKNKFSMLDAITATAMGPRGLACAVLATLPLQKGIIGGEWLQATLFAIIPFTIGACALFVALSNTSIFKFLLGGLFKSYPETIEEKDPLTVQGEGNSELE